MSQVTRIALLVTAIGSVVACAQKPAATTTDGADAEVYRAYLTERKVVSPDSLYVAESTLVYHAPESVPTDKARFPFALQTALESASSTKAATASLSLPYPLHVLTPADIKEIFGSDPRAGWDRFHQLFPRTKSFWGFSPIAYNDTRTESLFYAESHCGPLCGAGELVWAGKDTSGVWRVRNIVGLWIS